MSYKEVPKLQNEYRGGEMKYLPAYLSGIMIKFNDNQISYRLSGSAFSKSDYSFINNCKNCEIINGNFKDYQLGLGFEKNILYGVIQPFYGSDISYKRITFEGTAFDIKSNSFLYDSYVEKSGAMLSPFIGVKANIFRARFTISAEAGLDLMYTYEKETKTDLADNQLSLNTFNRWGVFGKPLGLLSLQINLGNQ